MKKVWWTWDVRMRWAHGFCASAESFESNYKAAVDSACKYGVEGIVIWGFLRDSHGGVESARRVCDYAAQHGVKILPGVGIDAYGGVFHEGDSPWSLDTYLAMNPGAQAIAKDGSPMLHHWPPTAKTARRVGCASNMELMDFYKDSLDWLVDTFDLGGFFIEQGDIGLCHCPKCKSRTRTTNLKKTPMALEDMSMRLTPIVSHALSHRKGLMILVENYCGFGPAEIAHVSRFLKDFPPEVFQSWQAYDAPARFEITEQSNSPTEHGCMAIRTNNDLFGGEMEDIGNIRKANRLGRQAGLDMTYIYGEYSDQWPKTAANYRAWADSAADDCGKTGLPPQC